MPTSRLNVAASGWACAQRRSLRAISHTLLIYDPDYLLVVDDDTFVSIDMLKPYGALDRYDPYKPILPIYLYAPRK